MAEEDAAVSVVDAGVFQHRLVRRMMRQEVSSVGSSVSPSFLTREEGTLGSGTVYRPFETR